MKAKLLMMFGIILMSWSTVTFSFCSSCESDYSSSDNCISSCKSCTSGWPTAYSDLCGNRYPIFRNIGATDDTDPSYTCQSND